MRILTTVKTSTLFLTFFYAGLGGCASLSSWQDPGLMYKANEFKEALRNRLPELTKKQTIAPFEVPAKAKQLARETISAAPAGVNPVQILVSVLTDAKPKGLGIEYDWAVSATAKRTLSLGRGDCVSLAMLLVGLGRSLDWPIYFAEARPENPTIHVLGELTVISSHMIVIVLTQKGPVMVDFLGLIDTVEYEIHPMDDLSAYAHLVNNVAAHQIASNASADHNAWEIAKDDFQSVTQIQPKLGRGWNNLGIAYTRLGQFEEARSAYKTAMGLDTIFGSPSRNLTIMETRASGRSTIIRGETAD